MFSDIFKLITVDQFLTFSFSHHKQQNRIHQITVLGYLDIILLKTYIEQDRMMLAMHGGKYMYIMYNYYELSTSTLCC